MDQLDHLLWLRGTVKKALQSGEASPQLVREATSVSRAIVAVSAEQRQRERHDKRTVEAMSPQERHRMVAEYLRDCDRDGREEFRRTLAELDAAESVLGLGGA